MIKTIPKSNISRRSFQAYKKQEFSELGIPIIKASKSSGTFFDPDSSPYIQVGDSKIYTGSLYSSIKAKYYSNEGNVFTQYGTLKNPATEKAERVIGNTIYVIPLPQSNVGEGIKKGSVNFVDNTNSIEYFDDGNGGIVNEGIVEYRLVSADIQNNELILTDGFETYELTLVDVDFQTGYLNVIYNSVQDDGTKILSTDFEEDTIIVDREFDLPILSEPLHFGNVFYKDGLIILTNTADITQYNLEYRSTSTIYETEVFLEVEEDEFNTSQNPTAVELTIRDSYEFETTEIPNILPSRTVVINEIENIRKKDSFVSEYNPLITGSWDDYKDNLDTDPSGSYLAPFITTIGIYDDDGEMVAIAKLPTPIKSFPDMPVNFIVRIDT